MTVNDSIEKLIGAIGDKIETFKKSDTNTPWVNVNKGYPTRGIFGEKMDLPSALYVLLKPEFSAYDHPVFLNEKQISFFKKNSSTGHEPRILEGEKPYFIPRGKFMIETEGRKLRDIPDKFSTEWDPERIKKAKVIFVPDTPEKLYNIDQTNLKEARPDIYAELTAASEAAELRKSYGHVLDRYPSLSASLENIKSDDLWSSKIIYGGPESFYLLTKNEIHMPPVENFDNPEAFYGELLHNMYHSAKRTFAPDEYTEDFTTSSVLKENLSADISSAMFALKYGYPKYPVEECKSINWNDIKEMSSNGYISDLMADAYKFDAYTDAIVRKQTSKIEMGMYPKPTNEQLRSMGRLLVKFAELSEYGINTHLNESDRDEIESIKYLDINKKVNRIDKLHEEYSSKEYLWGYDLSDPKQLNDARLRFYKRLYESKEDLNQALRRLETAYGKEAIEQLNKYDRRTVLSTVTLPYSVIQYINTGEMNRRFSEKDMNIINDFIKSFGDKKIEARIIPNGGRSYNTLPLEAGKQFESSLYDVEIFTLPESLSQDKQPSKGEKEEQEHNISQSKQEYDEQEEEKPRRGFHR